MSDCLFCAILKGKQEASFVYKDKLCAAFMDIHPVNPGHLLVVPIQHKEWFEDIDKEVASHMFGVAQDIVKAIKKNIYKLRRGQFDSFQWICSWARCFS